LSYRVLADVVVAAHYAFLAFVAVGGFIAWRWPRVLPLHLVAVGWGVVVVAAHLPCPLTALQNNLRERGGLPPLHASFIDTYIRGTFYPANGAVIAWLLIAALVAVSWIGLIRKHRRGAIRLASRG
jgi:hypothetical protein